jgi:hypothetical protein
VRRHDGVIELDSHGDPYMNVIKLPRGRQQDRPPSFFSRRPLHYMNRNNGWLAQSRCCRFIQASARFCNSSGGTSSTCV